VSKLSGEMCELSGDMCELSGELIGELSVAVMISLGLGLSEEENQ
jgi:hypothetical protein